MRSRYSTIVGLLTLLGLWQLAGQNGWVADGVLPAPSAILTQIFSDRAEYLPHVMATAKAAFLGFAAGNAIALIVAMLVIRWPLVERWTAGINIAIFTVPPIAVVPVLLIVLDAQVERVVIAALMVYYTSLVSAILGMRQADTRALDVVHAYGGGAWTALRLIRFRSGLPTMLAGLRIAAPNAVLGAILGEFGSGLRWGLGSFLLGSMGRADPVRLWGIGLVATALAGFAYSIAWLLGVLFTRGATPATLATGRSHMPVLQTRMQHLFQLIGTVLLPFTAWWLLLDLARLSPIIAKTPAGVFEYLFTASGAGDSRATLISALAITMPHALYGLAVGILFAFILAILGVLMPPLVRSLMPIALVSQSMPLVALTPLIVLLFGRGLTATLVIAISVTFFPAFVTISEGLAQVPKIAFDVVRSYGAGPFRQLFSVAIPFSTPYILAAARLAAPRALLGVMIAEWLATGVGLGNLLNQSRGMLDYGMIWAVAFVSVAVATMFYAVVFTIESILLRRF
ncbi:ABC transporter permease [Thiomonas delicata]|uniref:ABC-type nitrate/sulfonate/bicarbonate transport system, permease component n=1 Tax=Thiomonas delicata TaxID=364030 RepID=A0A238D9Q5_THIDL|nr:ABC transporter permease subunit [Thiomonas delicata]SBP90053.1 ABC-type nitrate/sulfonate/bicarbonate transport system, permease component [Thiomonas delicata]